MRFLSTKWACLGRPIDCQAEFVYVYGLLYDIWIVNYQVKAQFIHFSDAAGSVLNRKTEPKCQKPNRTDFI